MDAPGTRYVAVGGADVAYQVVGSGPIDLCYFYGIGHIDLRWDHPLFADFLQALASFSRLILFDRRGTGASDPVPDNAIPTWEEWTDDLRAVLDAVGSDRTAIFAEADGGAMGMLFSAMHPERVSALILANTSARAQVASDYPIGVSPVLIEAAAEFQRSAWGTPEMAMGLFPSRLNDANFIAWVAKIARAAMTPHSAEAQIRNFVHVDVRRSLSLVQAPTLVLHTAENPWIPFEHGRYIADHIPGARFVELPGNDAYAFGSRLALEEITEFLTGARPVAEIERVLTTVLFSDIVASTERAASLGDQSWRSLLDAHDRLVREELRRFRGIEINTTGDGFVASFDGPARAIRCALAILEVTKQLGVTLRVGIHTGECEVRGDDLGGLSVHIAARVGALAPPGEILVSGTVKDLVVGSGIEFNERGEHNLRGIPGAWKLFTVTS